MDDDLTGRLLIAGPPIMDPNFTRTVVLVCEHGDSGALGLVINRVTDIPLADHLPSWLDAVAPPPLVFAGGPVAPQVAVGLAHFAPDATPGSFTAILPGIGLIDLSAGPPAPGALRRIRVFAGYAGWSAGQLEAELAEPGAWFVADARPDDPFTEEPGGLRRAVLRRQAGTLRLLEHYPPSPRLN